MPLKQKGLGLNVFKIGMLILFFVVMASVGISCRKHATDKTALSSRTSVFPWLTAFAYGTSYTFSAVIFVGWCRIRVEVRPCVYMDQVSETLHSAHLFGWSWEEEPVL